VENSKIKSEKDPIKALISLVESLRGQPGCPWDKKQTPKTMLIYLIEEMYELADAIESNCEETGHFSIYDVARDITEKMIRRHPHVFGAARVDSTDEIRQNWYQIKQSEKKQSKKDSVLDSVPINLPALMRAYRIGERTARCGFEWEDRESLLDTLNSEFDQLKSSIANDRSDRISHDFGELLFSLVNLARLSKIHPESALSGAVKAFEKRFRKMEKEVSAK
jgi:tetrapyrrole methylase family protein/MazG family protein